MLEMAILSWTFNLKVTLMAKAGRERVHRGLTCCRPQGVYPARNMSIIVTCDNRQVGVFK